MSSGITLLAQQQRRILNESQQCSPLPATPAATITVLDGSAVETDSEDDVGPKPVAPPSSPVRVRPSHSRNSSTSSRFAFTAALNAAKNEALGSLRWAISSSSDAATAVATPATASGFVPRTRRAQEHLAVTLSRALWKNDADAPKCDTFACTTVFSLFERKHHCRKCGGIFCQACSSRTIELLDTTSLPYIHPPADVIDQLISDPAAPYVLSRVCDDCWHQVHGLRTPATAFSRDSGTSDSRSVSPRPRSVGPRRRTSGNESLEESVMIATPPEGQPLPSALGRSNSYLSFNDKASSGSSAGGRRRRSRDMSNTPPVPSTPSSNRRRQTRMLLPHEMPIPREALEQRTPGGLLDDYPLKNPSAICKRLGGGVWKPKPVPVRYDSYGSLEEVDDSDDEDAKWKVNPIVKDGDIQTRVPQGPPPPKPHRPLFW